jgi:hypothetical protein
MSREIWGPSLTFALSCVSATFFLVLRCEGRGRAFGPASRWWALLVIGLTGLLSSSVALGLALLGHYLPTVVLGLGIAAPSSLALGRIREGIPDRRSIYGAATTLWLGWLLARMSEGMTEDKVQWCERHIDPAWHNDELILAAHFYHDYLDERLSDEERKRFRIRVLLHDLETRLDFARLIDAHATRSAIKAALDAHRIGREARYQRSLDDLTRLSNRLRHDALRDLDRMLAAAYCACLYRLPEYSPPASGFHRSVMRSAPRSVNGAYAGARTESAGSPSPHP